VAFALSQGEQGGLFAYLPQYTNVAGGLGLSAIGIIPAPTIIPVNIGTQDALITTGGRYLLAGHTDLSMTPMVGAGAVFNTTASYKGVTVVILH
jgi:hypothetical protein